MILDDLYLSNEGFFQLRGDYPSVLNHFLVGEVGFDNFSIKQIISGLNIIVDGGVVWEWSGNAHHIEINLDSVVIENEFCDEYKCQLKFDDFRSLIFYINDAFDLQSN